jgi:hypothetical protein
MWSFIRRSIWLGHRLNCKHYTRVEVIESDKHSSLFRQETTDYRKMIKNSMPCSRSDKENLELIQSFLCKLDRFRDIFNKQPTLEKE